MTVKREELGLNPFKNFLFEQKLRMLNRQHRKLDAMVKRTSLKYPLSSKEAIEKLLTTNNKYGSNNSELIELAASFAEIQRRINDKKTEERATNKPEVLRVLNKISAEYEVKDATIDELLEVSDALNNYVIHGEKVDYSKCSKKATTMIKKCIEKKDADVLLRVVNIEVLNKNAKENQPSEETIKLYEQMQNE